MSLKYSLVFLLLAAGCVVSALARGDIVGWFGIAMLYTAASFLLLAVAYAGAAPKLLGKRASGRQSMWSWVLFAPYFLLNALLFQMHRLLSGEPAFVQVAPNVFFGRRLLAHECAAIHWVAVLDLASEFPESVPLRKLTGYQSLPILDATAPTEEQLRWAVAWMAEKGAAGPVYVHCALGHGRSACVVIAYLLATGTVRSVAEGVRQLRGLRPGVRLQPCQRERLRAFELQPVAGGVVDFHEGGKG
jgi:protein-tyrosine phosphatase